MRRSYLAAALCCGVAFSAPAFAQAPTPPTPPAPDAGAAPASGSSSSDGGGDASTAPATKPMHHGTGSSMASHTSEANTRGEIAPRLPAPKVGQDASASEYLTAAKQALKMKHTGEAQEALEMAETRALDRSMPADQSGTPDSSPMVTSIHTALKALGNKDMAGANSAIDQALGGKAGMSDDTGMSGHSGMSGHAHMHHMMHNGSSDGSSGAAPAAQ